MAMRQIVSNLTAALHKLGRLAIVSSALMVSSPALLIAQAAPQSAASLVTTRITQPINEKVMVTLSGTVHPLANKANDRGAAPDGMQLERMHMVLKRNSGQESALKQLVSDMHTPGTASYHKWLTPEQFGQQFGPSDQDISTVETWLQSKGFSVTSVNPGKQTLEFSGNAAQFRTAFHAQIHKYLVNGETHYANSTDPQIPAALAPVVGGFVSLNNFRPKRNSRVLGTATYDPKSKKATPQWTYGTSAGVNFPLAPADYALQYDIQPLYNAGINGAGQAIAIVNDSNINIALVNQFRTLFNLPANPPQIIIDGNDPGIDGTNNPDGPNGDSGEAYLDVEWSGAVAPAATVDLVIGADTALASGLILAAEHAVYANVAPIISMSFGLGCEVELGSNNQFVNSLWEQAAAQGITVMVSTGDAAAAGCDNDNTQFYAVNGTGVSGLASTPYNVAVGGTDFYYSSFNQGSTAVDNQLATYWNTTPTQSPAVSIMNAPIPEQPWNDSQYGLNASSIFTESGSEQTSIAGGAGGASSAAICSAGFDPFNGACIGTPSGYPKPAWQTGFGTDTVRDLPDVSLYAADGLNFSYYPICFADGDCQPATGSNLVQITGVGGTSASSPSFAGIMALVNQKYGRQGQADFVLYPLSKQFPTAFHDVQNGNNSVPCNINTTSAGVPASPNCISVSNPLTVTDPTFGTATEGQTGTGTTPDYNAGVGYDLASGLGTIDANQLVTNWGNVKFTTTTTTLTPSSTSFTHGTAITVSGSVTVASGTPTGSVAMVTSSTEEINSAANNFFTLSNGTFSNSSVNYLPGGTYNIWGQYSGDGTNGASTSTQTQITVAPENSGIFFNVISPMGTVPSGTGSIDYGTQLNLSAQVTPSSQLAAVQACQTNGTTCPAYEFPTGTVTFADNGSTINTAVVNSMGDAEYNAPFAVGSHSIVTSYSGDNSYNKSTTTASTYTVVKDTPAFAISAASQFLPAGAGAAFTGQINTFNIQVANGAQINSGETLGTAAPVPVAPPTGTVTVSGFPSGVPTSGTLTAGVVSGLHAVQGIATIAAPANTPAGTYNITINYSGDANYNAASASTAVTIASPASVAGTGTAASTTTATASMNSTSPTAGITISGTVTGQSGKAPTGAVVLYSSGSGVTEVGLTATSATGGYTGIFGGGAIYKNDPSELVNSGFTEVIIWSVEVSSTGDLNLNGEFPLTSGGVYVGNSTFPNFPAYLASLKQGTVKRITFSIGSSNVGDFQDIESLVNSQGTGPSSILYKDFQALKAAIPSIDAIDLDDENNFDEPSTAAFAVMLHGLGYNVMPDAFDNSSYWTGLVSDINGQSAGTVDGVHLQAYAGGAGNTPCSGWDFGSVPVFPGLWDQDDTASQMQSQIGTWHSQCGITGAFFWLYDDISGKNEAAEFASAINAGLGITSTSNSSTASFSIIVNSQTLFQGANFVTLQYTGDGTYAPSDFTLSNPISNPLSDFSIVPQMTIVPVPAAGTNTDSINATSVNGFNGLVNFTCATNTISCTITPSATLSPGNLNASASSNSSLLTLTINAGSAANGTYNVLVTGTDSTGKFIHTLAIQAVVSNSTAPPTETFTLSANPTTIPAFTGGSSGTSQITVNPVNGFTGTVALTCAVTGPSGATSPVTCAYNPASVSGSGTSTLTVGSTATTTTGNYTVTIIGISGSDTEYATVNVTVNAVNPSFTLTPSPSTVTISSPGGTGTSTITINSQGGFSGAVSLACSSITGPTGAVNPPTCSFSPVTNGTSTLTITITATTTIALNSPLNKLFAVGGGLAVAGLLFCGIPARRRSWRTILGILVFAGIVGMGIGCGSGSSSGSGSGSAGTTAGAYVVTVTGTSGSITQATTVNVTVN
jgi:trimeric autotransporter adhesin